MNQLNQYFRQTKLKKNQSSLVLLNNVVYICVNTEQQIIHN